MAEACQHANVIPMRYDMALGSSFICLDCSHIILHEEGKALYLDKPRSDWSENEKITCASLDTM